MAESNLYAGQTFKVACVQNCAESDMGANIAAVGRLVRAAADDGAELICLPENFSFLGSNDAELVVSGAFVEDEHPALAHFRDLAQQLNRWLLLGSLTVKVSVGKVNNRSYVLSPQGEIVGHYNKLHLFDVDLPNGETYKESASVVAGDEPVVVKTPWGGLGLSICYDLRFAYLYRRLAQAGAAFLAIPAAFTRTTGLAHWHVLVRARAIETGCYVFAAGQCGVRKSGRATYGHSLIVDPWGEIIADAGDNVGYITATVDPQVSVGARDRIPALAHDRTLSDVRIFDA